MSTTPSQARQLRIVAPAFDLGRARCAAESRLWAAITANEGFHKRITGEVTERQGSLVQGRLNLRTESYLVDPQITPELHQVVQTLRRVLRLVQPIDVFVTASPELNAFCLPSRKQSRFLMGLHSSLFQLFTSAELLFVMGHELGHALLAHARVPKIGFDHPDFSPLEVVRLRALERRQEISCDRVSLLACQDLRAAASALFKLMCGLPASWLRSFDEEAFAKHFDTISDMAEVADLENATGTHPIIPLRVKALLSFANSSLYAEALGLPQAQVSADELEKATEHLLSVLEPDLSAIEATSEEEAANRFVVRGAMVVAAADGVLQPAEMAFLRSKLAMDQGLPEAAVAAPDFIPRTLAEMAEEAQVLRRKLSLNDRAGLLHVLTLVAMSAGGFVDGEQAALIEVAKMLDLSPEVYRRVVGSASPAPSEPAPTPKKRRRRAPKAREAAPQPQAAPEAPSGDPTSSDAPR